MGLDAMTEWDELGMLYAIHNHAHSIKRKRMHWRKESDAADKLGAAGAQFDASVIPEPVPEPIKPPKVRYSFKRVWEAVAAA